MQCKLVVATSSQRSKNIIIINILVCEFHALNYYFFFFWWSLVSQCSLRRERWDLRKRGSSVYQQTSPHSPLLKTREEEQLPACNRNVISKKKSSCLIRWASHIKCTWYILSHEFHFLELSWSSLRLYIQQGGPLVFSWHSDTVIMRDLIIAAQDNTRVCSLS